MGFLDRAKKLAQQAKEFAGDQIEQRRQPQGTQTEGESPQPGAPTAPTGEAKQPKPPGTPAGELGERWKKLDLPDPAGVVPPKVRQGAGVPRSTHSEVVSEPYGIARRWTDEGKSIGVFWLIDPDAQPSTAEATSARFDALRGEGAEDVPGIGDGAYITDLGNDRRGVFVRAQDRGLVVEVAGSDHEAAVELAQAASAYVTR